MGAGEGRGRTGDGGRGKYDLGDFVWMLSRQLPLFLSRARDRFGSLALRPHIDLLRNHLCCSSLKHARNNQHEPTHKPGE